MSNYDGLFLLVPLAVIWIAAIVWAGVETFRKGNRR